MRDTAMMTPAPSDVHVCDSEWTAGQHDQRSRLLNPSRRARLLCQSFLAANKEHRHGLNAGILSVPQSMVTDR